MLWKYSFNAKTTIWVVHPVLILASMIWWNLFSSLWYSIIVPFLPLEFEKFNLEVEIYGYIYASYAASAMLTWLVVGRMLSYCGRRIILVSGMVQLGCAMVSYGFIHYWPNNVVLTIVWIWIRSIEGVSSSMILTTWYSVISITYRQQQTKYLGFLESSSGFGMLIGPIIGSVMYKYFKKRI